MYNIAICDDDAAEVANTEGMLRNYMQLHPTLEYEIATFSNAQMLLSKVWAGYMPDLILTDVCMEGKTGIEAVRVLRDAGNACHVIFLTFSEAYALEAFSLDADQYLLKPVAQERLFSVLDKILGAIFEQRRFVVVKIEDQVRRIMVRDIVYCEAHYKNQHIFLMDSSNICLRMSMKKLEEMFLPYDEIVRIGRGCIVNLNHVESLKEQIVRLDNGKCLSLSKGAYQVLKKSFIALYG